MESKKENKKIRIIKINLTFYVFPLGWWKVNDEN